MAAATGNAIRISDKEREAVRQLRAVGAVQQSRRRKHNSSCSTISDLILRRAGDELASRLVGLGDSGCLLEGPQDFFARH